jgi:hypothetical protein
VLYTWYKIKVSVRNSITSLNYYYNLDASKKKRNRAVKVWKHGNERLLNIANGMTGAAHVNVTKSSDVSQKNNYRPKLEGGHVIIVEP